MTRVLVVNHAHSVVCGIHDLGKRIAECLRHSLILDVNCLDIATANAYQNALDITEPDAVIVNYRADLMPWFTADGRPTFAVLHQYEEATADVRAAELLGRFDGVLVLDPLLHPSDPRVHAVGRPIPETVTIESLYAPMLPIVGSFGFAFPHKGFANVAAEINDQLDEATFNLHMPEAYFNGANGERIHTEGILAACAAEIHKPGIEVHYTNEHFAERELVARLAQNDVNCLFYAPGQPDAGLSSALDYLIAARRPMLLSEADMFRVVPDVPRWPETRLGDILDNYDKHQQHADELYAWHHGRLVADIERIVSEL